MGRWVVGGWIVGGLVVGEAKSRGLVGHGSCLFENKKKRYTLAPSMLSANLQMPAHELISPTPFIKLSPINYEQFSFWSGKQFW